MPVKTGKDNEGCFAQWGSGKKYHYPCGDTAAMNKAKQKAHLQAAAARRSGFMEEQFDWKKHDRHFDVTEAEKPQEKPGGSNVGSYPDVKTFCGPSGGAPEGSFPVNSRKRGIAALSYARNAPNPEGIRACVFRHFPELKPEKAKEDIQEACEQFIEDCK